MIELAIVIGVVCYILVLAYNYTDDGVNMDDEYRAYLLRECERLGKSGTQASGDER
jgi:hypothetical protein